MNTIKGNEDRDFFVPSHTHDKSDTEVEAGIPDGKLCLLKIAAINCLLNACRS